MTVVAKQEDPAVRRRRPLGVLKCEHRLPRAGRPIDEAARIIRDHVEHLVLVLGQGDYRIFASRDRCRPRHNPLEVGPQELPDLGNRLHRRVGSEGSASVHARFDSSRSGSSHSPAQPWPTANTFLSRYRN